MESKATAGYRASPTVRKAALIIVDAEEGESQLVHMSHAFLTEYEANEIQKKLLASIDQSRSLVCAGG